MRLLVALLLVIVVAACGGEVGTRARVPVVTPSPRLPPPQPIDPRTRGAPYLVALGNQIQPRWAQFLEDCRLRLPHDHPLNTPALVASVELVVGPGGKLTERFINGSGNPDFDGAVRDVLKEITPPPATLELESDDGLVHIRWLFARDRRQGGPATAELLVLELPLLATVQRLLAPREPASLARAAKRIAASPPADPDRPAATELVMTEALRSGLESFDGTTRIAALDAVRRAKLVALAPEVHRLIAASGLVDQRIQALGAAAALGNPEVAPLLVEGLAADFEDRPEVALAKVTTLVALRRQSDTAAAIRTALADTTRKTGVATAIAALAIVPDPELAPELARWFTRGDTAIRASVCHALPTAALGQATSLVLRGLRDPGATVRAACAGAAARQGPRIMRTTIARLLDLMRDRDEAVRAHAIAAIGVLAKPSIDAAQRARVVALGMQDRAPRVRAATAGAAGDPELRTLAKDKDPDVRAAALVILADRGVGDRSPDLALAAASDPASQVRRAAVPGITDDAMLEKLAGDDDPEVSTAALVRYAARRGQAAVTNSLLQRLVAATPKSLERVRIARAWLLAQ